MISTMQQTYKLFYITLLAGCALFIHTANGAAAPVPPLDISAMVTIFLTNDSTTSAWQENTKTLAQALDNPDYQQDLIAYIKENAGILGDQIYACLNRIRGNSTLYVANSPCQRAHDYIRWARQQETSSFGRLLGTGAIGEDVNEPAGWNPEAYRGCSELLRQILGELISANPTLSSLAQYSVEQLTRLTTAVKHSYKIQVELPKTDAAKTTLKTNFESFKQEEKKKQFTNVTDKEQVVYAKRFEALKELTRVICEESGIKLVLQNPSKDGGNGGGANHDQSWFTFLPHIKYPTRLVIGSCCILLPLIVYAINWYQTNNKTLDPDDSDDTSEPTSESRNQNDLFSSSTKLGDDFF